jgi:chromosome segregation ATPase
MGNAMIARNLVNFLAGSALALIGASAAVGQSPDAKLQAISGMVGELNAAKAEEAAQAKASTATDDRTAIDKKELKVYADQIAPLKTAYDAVNKDTATHNAETARQQAVVQTHNNNCGGKTLPKPAADRCNGESTQLNAWGARINAAKAVLDRRTGELNKKRDSIVARAKVLETEIAKFEAQKQDSLNKMEQARKRIAALTARLGGMCTSIPATTNLEEIKLKCGNVNFDGSDPKLLPCDTEKCREYDRLQGGR